MKNKYYIHENDDTVSISLKSSNHDFGDYLDGFIDIWVEGDETESPFENIKTARKFAEIIVKLLEEVT